MQQLTITEALIEIEKLSPILYLDSLIGIREDLQTINKFILSFRNGIKCIIYINDRKIIFL